jgi:hypothetical protein
MRLSLPVVFVVAVFLTPLARADSYKGTRARRIVPGGPEHHRARPRPTRLAVAG